MIANQASEPRGLMRVSEVAPLLGVTSGRVYQLVKMGEIPAIRVGRAIRIPKAALEAWLQRCAIDARRNARQLAAKRSDSGPAFELEKALTEATRLLSEKWPFGWRGTATELLEALEQHREGEQGAPVAWPQDGRGLSIAIRRLAEPLVKVGVRLELGHRGHAGTRLIFVTRASSAAPRRIPRKAAISASLGSPHSRGGKGGEGPQFPKYIELPAPSERLQEWLRKRDAERAAEVPAEPDP
jgi:excisionase family DNA binding protein